MGLKCLLNAFFTLYGESHNLQWDTRKGSIERTVGMLLMTELHYFKPYVIRASYNTKQGEISRRKHIAIILALSGIYWGPSSSLLRALVIFNGSPKTITYLIPPLNYTR